MTFDSQNTQHSIPLPSIRLKFNTSCSRILSKPSVTTTAAIKPTISSPLLGSKRRFGDILDASEHIIPSKRSRQFHSSERFAASIVPSNITEPQKCLPTNNSLPELVDCLENREPILSGPEKWPLPIFLPERSSRTTPREVNSHPRPPKPPGHRSFSNTCSGRTPEAPETPANLINPKTNAYSCNNCKTNRTSKWRVVGVGEHICNACHTRKKLLEAPRYTTTIFTNSFKINSTSYQSNQDATTGNEPPSFLPAPPKSIFPPSVSTQADLGIERELKDFFCRQFSEKGQLEQEVRLLRSQLDAKDEESRHEAHNHNLPIKISQLEDRMEQAEISTQNARTHVSNLKSQVQILEAAREIIESEWEKAKKAHVEAETARLEAVNAHTEAAKEIVHLRDKNKRCQVRLESAKSIVNGL